MTTSFTDRKLDRDPVSFVIGLGAQKSGSTWLFEFLRDHPETAMGSWKEYGFWDNYFLGNTNRKSNYGSRLSALKSKQARDGLESLSEGEKRQFEGLSTSLALMEKPELYLAHFRRLADSHSEVRVVGDVTPSYCRLGASHLVELQQHINAAGFALKPVFIMRDPVTRIVSALDMKLRRQGRRASEFSDREIEDALRKVAQSSSGEDRTNYRRTVEALDQAFGADSVFFGFYETLFSASEIKRLLYFLNLSWWDPPLKKE